jgi:hypothetical protein
MQGVETFSMRLFLSTSWGAALGVLGVLTLIGCSLLAWFKLISHPRLKALNEGRLRWLSVPAFFVMLGTPLVLLAVWSPYAGSLTGAALEARGDERFITATFFSRGKNGGGTTTRKVFSMDGHILGSRSSGCNKRSAWHGVGPLDGFDVERAGDQITVLDSHTLREVADVTEALDRRYGEDQYQVKRVDGQGVYVLLKDGQEVMFPLQEVIPTGRGDDPQMTLRAPLLDSGTCATSRSAEDMRGKPKLLEGISLLRARPVFAPSTSSNAEACVYLIGGLRAVLALHSDAAFGDDGAHLLSALREGDRAAALWTVDIGPALGALWMVNRYTIHAPEVRADTLCFWLIRDSESLSEVCVDAATGALQSAKVIF